MNELVTLLERVENPGAFSVKIPNLFATLVINLPSAHEGGELIISHAGQSQRYSFADVDTCNLL